MTFRVIIVSLVEKISEFWRRENSKHEWYFRLDSSLSPNLPNFEFDRWVDATVKWKRSVCLIASEDYGSEQSKIKKENALVTWGCGKLLTGVPGCAAGEIHLSRTTRASRLAKIADLTSVVLTW